MRAKKPIPAGFRLLDWADAEPNTIVYRQDVLGAVIGPYIVVDAAQRTLCATHLTTAESFGDAALLLRNGPVIVVTLVGSALTGIYTDIPAEIAVLNTDRLVKLLRRPRALDRLPGIYQATLLTEPPAGWPELAGKYDVTEAGPVSETTDFTLTHRPSVMALTATLIREGFSFAVKSNRQPTPTVWTFTLANEARQFVLQITKELLNEEPRITRTEQGGQ